MSNPAFIWDPALIRDPAFICTVVQKLPAFNRDPAFTVHARYFLNNCLFHNISGFARTMPLHGLVMLPYGVRLSGTCDVDVR